MEAEEMEVGHSNSSAVIYPSLQHFSTPVDKEYAALIGHATYAFVYLEWQIVHMGEKLAPGFIYKVATMTAHKIGKAFESKVTAFVGNSGFKSELMGVASKFLELVVKRNHLVHAHPATIHGKQRLNYWNAQTSFTWEPKTLEEFICEVEALNCEGNKLYTKL